LTENFSLEQTKYNIITGFEISRKNVLISVIMPIYYPNLHYFKEAVYSIINQTYSEIEIIIISDGHDEPIKNFIDELNDIRIYFIINAVKMGLAGSINKGIELANGELIARMDSDDIAHSNRIERQCEEFLKNKNLVLVGSNTLMVHDNSNITIGVRDYPETTVLIRKYLFNYCPFAHSSVMFKKTVLDCIGYYATNRSCEDYDLWMRIVPFYDCYNIQEYLMKIRNIPTSVRGKNVKIMQMDNFLIKIEGLRRIKKKCTYNIYISLIINILVLIIPYKILIVLFNALVKMGYYRHTFRIT